MQKFLNNLIFRSIQDSSVSNTSHHPQFGGGETGAILVTHIPVCFVEEIRGESRFCSKVGRLGVPGKCWQHHKQNPHLPGTNEKAGIYMKVFYTGCLQFMILRNYGCVTD